ncbi:hypothetical protein V8E51_015020 [Hyaloscypha variabilis]
MGCGNYTLCSALGDQIGLTSYFGAVLEAVASNSTHAMVVRSKGFVIAPAQAPEFVANVFGNGSDYMQIMQNRMGSTRLSKMLLTTARTKSRSLENQWHPTCASQYVTPILNIRKIVTENLTIESIVSPGVNLTYEAGVTSLQRLL